MASMKEMVRPKIRSYRYMPRLSAIPLVMVAGVVIVYFILYFEASLFDSNGIAFVFTPWIDGSQVVGSIQPVSCQEAIHTSLKNSSDANLNQLYLRYIDDDPRFWISLHVKGYDKVRWGVMDHGRYYEQIQVCIILDERL